MRYTQDMVDPRPLPGKRRYSKQKVRLFILNILEKTYSHNIDNDNG
jgi:hypothetical protein